MKASITKEELVEWIHEKLKLETDVENDRFTTYGHFFWKMNIDELMYIKEILKN